MTPVWVVAKHPFNTCKMFQALLHEQKLGMVKDNQVRAELSRKLTFLEGVFVWSEM